jgi:hypothetical protein
MNTNLDLGRASEENMQNLFGLDFSERSPYDRRNPYRRPSALGVPARHLTDYENTEYNQQVLQTELNVRYKESREEKHD